LRNLEARIDGQPMAPLSVLGALRHKMIDTLNAAATCAGRRCRQASVTPVRLASPVLQQHNSPNLHVLCRSLEHVESALDHGVASVIADMGDSSQCPAAVDLARRRGIQVLLATPRIQKPGERSTSELIGFRPDGILARNLAAVSLCAERHVPFVADFSLNAVNELTVDYLHRLGAQRVTVAYDLSPEQILDLAGLVPPEWLEVIVYAHVPMFHTEHRIPEERLRDRRNARHHVRVDACGRTTVYHAAPRDLTPLVPELVARGVRHFRVELLDGVRSAGLGRIETVIPTTG
jgi:U32 family peptidase